MFTGIIETIGTISHIETKGSNLTFSIKSTITNELKVDQSVAHNGVCLTVESIVDTTYTVTAIDETLHKTNAGNWKINDAINLERCLQFNGRIDGHLVQGHVDATGICTEKIELEGSWLYRFNFNEQFAPLLIEKGSVCINGISLTCFNVGKNEFSVAIIPYTYKHTNMQNVVMNTVVNLEFDVIGKYLNRFKELQMGN